MSKIDDFIKEREELNSLILNNSTRNTKRFFNLDSAVYNNEEIPAKYKELMGLVASTVLRCDDCILYHILQSKKYNISDNEFIQAMDIALIVGGSIVIPHLRRAYKHWYELKEIINND